ncbi:hypothetical protein PG657_10250, partial [Riemerella anatipestifer]|nr:hypothetical protein [Riemerella anatipestifer]
LFNSSEFCEKQNKKVRNDKIVIILFILYGFFYDIAHNGPRLGDSGGLESQNFQSCTNLSNSLFLFSKFMKKGNIKGCCDKKRRNFQFLP